MLGVRILLVASLAIAGPVPSPQESFIAKGTNHLATALLQSHQGNENFVFAPLGINTLLAIFAEGAKGETRKEIADALFLPDDVQVLRESYKSLLSRYTTKNPNFETPEMKNWFYVYKNYTVNDDLKKVLAQYYLTEVKSVDRPDKFEEPSAPPTQNKEPEDDKLTKVKVPAGLQGKPTDHLINPDKQVEAIIESASSPHKTDGEEAATSNKGASLVEPSPTVQEKPLALPEKEHVSDERLPGSSNSNEKSQISEKEENELKKIDGSHMNNIQPAIVPPGKEEIKEQIVENAEVKPQMEKESTDVVKEVGTVADKEVDEVKKVEELKEDVKPVEVKVTEQVAEDQKTEAYADVKKEEVEKSHEVNKPVEVVKESTDEKIFSEVQKLTNITEADLTGTSDSAVKGRSADGKKIESKMLVFNGLYFKGHWDLPLVKKDADDSRPFFKANNQEVHVKTLHGEGLYETADIPELKSRALQLKYQDGRYSLLILVPYSRDGLPQLVNDLPTYPLSLVQEKLEEKFLEVCLPTFYIISISRPLAASKGGLLNIKNIFNPEAADLSGISDQPGLHVEDLVQMVTFTVDSNYTEANFLSASVAASRSDVDAEKVRVNQPFLFFLRDNQDGVVVVNGKVTDPTSVEDEFTKISLRNAVKTII